MRANTGICGVCKEVLSVSDNGSDAVVEPCNSCTDQAREAGYNDGQSDGHSEGYDEGYAKGKEDAEAESQE